MQKLMFFLIRAYQIISPYKKAILPYDSQCKFYPSCSEYAILSLKKYGTTRGIFKIIVRLLKCNPISKGGVDFP